MSSSTEKKKIQGWMMLRDREKILNTKYRLSRPSMWLLIRKACFDDVT